MNWSLKSPTYLPFIRLSCFSISATFLQQQSHMCKNDEGVVHMVLYKIHTYKNLSRDNKYVSVAPLPKAKLASSCNTLANKLNRHICNHKSLGYSLIWLQDYMSLENHCMTIVRLDTQAHIPTTVTLILRVN